MSEAAWRRRFRAPRVSFPDWARDDPERLTYLCNAPGRWELFAWDRRDGVHRQVTDRPEGTWMGGPDASGDRVLWFDDDKGDEHGRWVAAPFDGGDPVPLALDLPEAYTTGIAAGRGVQVVGTSSEEGSAVHLVSDGASKELYRHDEEAFVGDLSRDETLICIGHSEHGDSRHPALRVLDREGATVADLRDEGLALWPGEWSPVPGDGRLLVLHERRDLPRPAVWAPATGGLLDVPLDLPGEVDASWYPDAAALLLVHDHHGRSEVYRYPLPGGPLERIDTPPGCISGAGVRPDGELWYRWTSSASPPQVRCGDDVVLEAPGELAPGGVAYLSHVVQGVHCFVALPEGPGPHPTLFDIHGGPESHDADTFDPHVQAWVDHGFAVVLVNYRGSTGYGRVWRDAIQGNPGLTELEDVAKVHDWVVAERIADPSRCVLSGGSWGGYLTLLGLGTQPGRWSLGIADVPVADYVAAYEDEMEPLKAFDRALFGGSPDEIREAYERRSPITYVAAVSAPVLILVGENDPRCPSRQVDNYLGALRELGRPHAVHRYDAGHGSLVTEETIRQVERKIAFAAEHLGTPAPL